MRNVGVPENRWSFADPIKLFFAAETLLPRYEQSEEKEKGLPAGRGNPDLIKN